MALGAILNRSVGRPVRMNQREFGLVLAPGQGRSFHAPPRDVRDPGQETVWRITCYGLAVASNSRATYCFPVLGERAAADTTTIKPHHVL